MPLREVQGDIFSARNIVRAHGVNCCGVMGLGIAVRFKQLYPEAYTGYREYCDLSAQPGDCFYYEGIFHLFVKDHWRNPSEIEWVESAVAKMDKIAVEEGIEEIHMPRIGCGLGGLDWKDVKAILQKCQTKIVVYTIQ